MRASWGVAVSDAINSANTMSLPRALMRDGPTGYGFAALPENRRNRDRRQHYWVADIKQVEDSDEVEGEWKFCRFQYGYDPTFGDGNIEGRDVVEDGNYYLEVKMAEDKFTLKHVDVDQQVPAHDPLNNVINMPVGKIEDGKQTVFIDMIPIIYKYV